MGRFGRPGGRLPVRQVAGMGPSLAAHAPDFCSGILESLELAAGDENVGTVGSERLDHLIAQATAAAGNQGHFAGEIEVVGHRGVFFSNWLILPSPSCSSPPGGERRMREEEMP